MRGAAFLIGLVGCGFHVSAAGDAGPPSDGDGNTGGEGGGPEAGTFCYGTTQFATICVNTPPTVDRTLSNTPITTSAGSPQCAQLSSGSSDVCAIVATAITLPFGVTVTATSARPLVLVATTGTITIAGVLDVAAKKAGPAGPGGDVGCNVGINPTGVANGGGQGGSFGSDGGDGGDSNNASDHGIHGAIVDPVTLRGGCAGADGGGTPASRGHGGGAVLLVAGTAISLPLTGAINASGAAGRGAPAGKKSGGGAGSGGLIVLDSPMISNLGAIYAHGGGGGGGSGNGMGFDGFDPGPNGGALGGLRGSSAGDGGAGSIGGTAGSTGGDGSNSTDGGGGGGGGAGIISVHQFSGVLGGLVSPPAR